MPIVPVLTFLLLGIVVALAATIVWLLRELEQRCPSRVGTLIAPGRSPELTVPGPELRGIAGAGE